MSGLFDSKTDAEQVSTFFKAQATDKYFIVTGANVGLGKETVRCLAKEGAHVVLCSRSTKNGEEAAAEIRAMHPAVEMNITVMSIDLGDLVSVKAFSEAYLATKKPLHCLINNAGIMACPKSLTTQGFESQFGVNHLGHFYLANLLLPVLRSTGTPEVPARVVVLSSMANILFGPRPQGIYFDDLKGNSYNPWYRYGQSKLANILFANELNKREKINNVTSVSLHPGNIISTNLSRSLDVSSMFSLVWAIKKSQLYRITESKNIPQGTSTTLVCALDPNMQGGVYYEDCKVSGKVHEKAFDVETAEKLWTVSLSLLAAEGFECPN